MNRMNRPRFLDSQSDNRKSKIQNRKLVGFFAILVLLVGCVDMAQAQQQAKVPKIGWLGARPAAIAGGRELLGRELRPLGYVDGNNIVFESRYAEGKYDRLPALADELVRLKVDVLVTPTDVEALAAKNATRSIPIIFLEVSDPVASGLVDSLARPGGISRASPLFRPCCLANDWSYSKKPFRRSPALR